ncbi:toll/interleukin-1 receptor domain-containing protein [Spirillospora sp. NPDC048911]|uniref:toll/interleukin-1 receptor domain-containing protein n=1 Tax=Spirillospora sp. NPDC048911 TaxID=3364527 RepID=UPI0037132440
MHRQTSGYDAFISYSHQRDGALAEALGSELQRFARPWYRARALRVFRDQTNLAAAPELWPAIVQALEKSEWFVLMASPASAQSKWVQREIHWWAAHRATQRVLIALTDGDIRWNNGDFDWSRTDAVSRSLSGAFPHEPLWIDLRHIRPATADERPQLGDLVAEFAAPIHGRDKDALVGEHVRQQRRTRRLTRTVIAALTTLLVVASLLAVLAYNSRNQAVERQRMATSRFLASEALTVLDDRQDLAALLAVRAFSLERTDEAKSALLAVLQHTPTVQRFLRSEGPRVESVAISPTGDLVAAGDSDGGVSFFTNSGRQTVPRITAHDGMTWAVAFTPDGRSVASAGNDGVVRLWNPRAGTRLREFRHRDEAVQSLAFSPDGRWLAAGGSAKRRIDPGGETGRIKRYITIVDTRTWKSTVDLFGHTGEVTNLTFAPDGKKLYSGGGEARLIGWSVPSWKAMDETFLPYPPDAIAVNPRGDLVATTDIADGVATVWEIETGAVRARLRVSDDVVTSLVFAPDGEELKGGTMSSAIVAWRMRDLAAGPRTVARHITRGESGWPELAIARTGALVVGTGMGAVILHQPGDQSRLVLRHGRLCGTGALRKAISVHQHILASADASPGAAWQWDHCFKEKIDSLLPAEEKRLFSALSPDGRRLTTQATVFDLDRKRALFPWPKGVASMAFSNDGSMIAVAGENGAVLVHDARTGARLEHIPPQAPIKEELALQASLEVWDPHGPALLFSPGDDILVVADVKGPVRLWKVDRVLRTRDAAISHPLLGHGRVNALAFSPTEDLLATGGQDQKISLWTLPTGRRVASMAANGRIYSLAFSPDGRMLASASIDHDLWAVPSGRRLGRSFQVADRSSSDIRFAADGAVLMVMADEFDKEFHQVRTVATVDLDQQSWVAKACALANRELTVEEWRQYVDPTTRPRNLCQHAT